MVQEEKQDPEALIDQIGGSGDLPAWVSAIPTRVTESLETLVAKPIKAVGDVEEYLERLVDEPEIASALSILKTAIPTSVHMGFESNSRILPPR